MYFLISFDFIKVFFFLFDIYIIFLLYIAKDAPTFIAAMKGTLQRMPEMFRIIFKYLITFLRMVSLKADINKMTPSNIAIVFAPNILRPKGNDIFTQMQDSGDANRLFEGLIGHCDAIFEVCIFSKKKKNNLLS